jgi:hypothetical protein
MRNPADIRSYQKTLVNYRSMAKTTIANALPSSKEYTEAIKVFLRCDGAIEVLSWVLEEGLEMNFGPPPIVTGRRKVK